MSDFIKMNGECIESIKTTKKKEKINDMTLVNSFITKLLSVNIIEADVQNLLHETQESHFEGSRLWDELYQKIVTKTPGKSTNYRLQYMFSLFTLWGNTRKNKDFLKRFFIKGQIDDHDMTLHFLTSAILTRKLNFEISFILGLTKEKRDLKKKIKEYNILNGKKKREEDIIVLMQDLQNNENFVVDQGKYREEASSFIDKIVHSKRVVCSADKGKNLKYELSRIKENVKTLNTSSHDSRQDFFQQLYKLNFDVDKSVAWFIWKYNFPKTAFLSPFQQSLRLFIKKKKFKKFTLSPYSTIEKINDDSRDDMEANLLGNKFGLLDFKKIRGGYFDYFFNKKYIQKK